MSPIVRAHFSVRRSLDERLRHFMKHSALTTTNSAIGCLTSMDQSAPSRGWHPISDRRSQLAAELTS